jgi:hypothetical protein
MILLTMGHFFNTNKSLRYVIARAKKKAMRTLLNVTKELREKAGIKAGDKLAVISLEREGEVCCITLMKADDFAVTVKAMLGPIMKEILA